MNIEQIRNKEYVIPKNIPPRTSHKYSEVIDKGYVKYLEIIDLCGKFIMYKQLYNLIKLLDKPNIAEETIERKTRHIIKRLLELGFVDSSSINKNKFLYLKKPAFAFANEDYINSSRVSLANDLKNDRFQIAILKVEYMLKTGEIIHSSTMFNQIKNITNHIYQIIIKTGNQYNYDTDLIEQIMEQDNYTSIKDLLKKSPEYQHKLGILRGLWYDLGNFYRKLVLQKQTVMEKPTFLKIYIKPNGEIILHYIPNIVIFDVSHDKKFYRDKTAKLFHAFYGIQGNSLREIQKVYMKDRTNMGFQGENHIGYRLTLIGADKYILEEKKAVIDEDINSSVNSPLMDFTEIVDLPIGKYLFHASRKGEEYYRKQDQMISNIIIKQLQKYRNNTLTRNHNIQESTSITTNNNDKVSAGQRILDLLNSD